MTSASRRLEDEVTCSICIEHFNDPRVLPCFHSFCRHCLEELAVHSEGRGKLVCPLCKAEFQISPADVPSLKVNFMINSIISVLLLTSEDSKKKPACESCDSGEPAQGRCNECDHFVCEQCISTHKRFRPVQHHTILSFDEIKSGKLLAMSKASFCTKHKGKKLKLFCESCKEVICRDCTVVDHKNHDYLFTSDVIAREKEEILGRAKKVASKLTDIEQAMALVEEAQQHLEENKRATRRDLDAFIDKQIGALEKMRSDLRGEIESACQKQEKQLTAQRENLSMRLASARSSLEFAERMCRDANDVDVLSIRNEVLSQLSSLAEKPVDQPCMEGGVRLVVDEEYWDSLSKKISVEKRTGLEQSAILSGKGPKYLRDLLGFLQPVQQSPESRWVRCFSAKRDGWAARTFHEKCDGKAPNIVLVSVGGRYVFGGYSDVAWTMSGLGYQSSSISFLFTLCNKNGYRPEKLPLRDPLDEYAIWDDTRYGPVFGSFGDLFIVDNAGGNEGSYTWSQTYARPQGAPSDGECDVFAGKYRFTPDEMEVFHEVVD
ncbi:tripartite motif-containing protein 45 isoform X1 [Nematostella vectensis]|nr:tripartite motif-containing protein 45 isoform X1 [Nematostella vectensis]